MESDESELIFLIIEIISRNTRKNALANELLLFAVHVWMGHGKLKHMVTQWTLRKKADFKYLFIEWTLPSIFYIKMGKGLAHLDKVIEKRIRSYCRHLQGYPLSMAFSKFFRCLLRYSWSCCKQLWLFNISSAFTAPTHSVCVCSMLQLLCKHCSLLNCWFQSESIRINVYGLKLYLKITQDNLGKN